MFIKSIIAPLNFHPSDVRRHFSCIHVVRPDPFYAVLQDVTHLHDGDLVVVVVLKKLHWLQRINVNLVLQLILDDRVITEGKAQTVNICRILFEA